MGSNLSIYEWASVGIKYIAVLGILGGLTVYYHQSSSPSRRASRVRPRRAASSLSTTPDTTASNDAKQPRERRRGEKRRDAATSDDGSTTIKPRPSGTVTHKDEQSSDMTDLAFANELASLKKGTTLGATSRAESRQKTVKQSSANKRAELSATSSTGAEADDDMSLSASPSLEAEPFPNSAGISDMLEAPRAGPAVLRLTESNQPAREKQNGQPRRSQAQETKKQRQHRKRAEEEKKIRQQQEEERRVLMEKQRRIAREARGEPAKNGITVGAPKTNPWDKLNGSGAVQAPITNGPLLDTFVDTGSNASSDAPVSGASTSNSEHHWERGLPDEDEQLRRILEADAASWNTVGVGKKNRRKPATNGNGMDSGDNPTNGAVVQDRRPLLFEQEA